jgi:hypothetical protein
MKPTVLLCAFVSLCLITAFAQAPSFDGGTWYGSINPPGTRFEVAVNFQNVGGWSGTLLMENGLSLPLREIVVQGNTISFSLDLGGQQRIRFKGERKGDDITGEFTDQKSTFPFQLSRTATPALIGAAIGIDPKEMIEAITEFTGSLSDRPFVPPVTYPPLGYGVKPSHDPVANLSADIQSGKATLKFEGEDGYLHSLLDALHVPAESQMAVFSKNSLQSPLIEPDNPRLLYFNDTVSVGWVRGGFLEIAAQDPEQGAHFYMLLQQPGEKPFIVERAGACLNCHLSRNSMDIPGMLLRSVYPSANGMPVNPLGSYLLDHRTKFEERWGGWYVTGDAGPMKHLGNGVVMDPEKESMTPLKQQGKFSSDIVALMTFEHQMHMMNLITRVGWEYRVAASLDSATGKRNETIARQLKDGTKELVDYLLFVDEVPLRGKIAGASGFPKMFEAMGPMDSKGRSLRQFDLEYRLMKYPCSYMIYSPAFDALPEEARKDIYARMREVMASKFSAADREAVTQILRETKKDF